MSTGRINIWITSEGDPCRISEIAPHTRAPWLVAIWDCSGRVLQWCGRRYFAMPARCGHLEVEVPPGCYVIRAAEGMRWTSEAGVRGNHWTDHGVVTVGCGQEACVTLFAPSAHNCGLGWLHVIQGLRAVNVLPPDLAEAAVKATQGVLERIPRAPFDIATEEAMVQLVKEAEEAKPDNRPQDPEPKSDQDRKKSV